MKLLFTGPLHDFSGFGHVSRNFLRMLLENKAIDVVARPLRYDQLDEGQRFEVPEWMKPSLHADLMDVHMAIQMTTCNVEAVPIPGILNGLYTFFEIDRLQPAWAAKANEFDFLIVPSRYNAETLLRSGVQKPILVAAPPCNQDEYIRPYSPFQAESIGNRVVFYNVCQLSYKKGIDILLRAYYAAFAAFPDDVLLVLKTYINMQDRANDFELVKQYINGVKARCRIPTNNHPPVLPLVYTMSDDEIHGLHLRGDAYVCTSRGEGWGIPVFDALAHGKTVISHNHQGLTDFVTPQNSLIYGGMQSLYYDMPHSDPLLFTGMESCFEPSPAELALVMQKFFLLRKGAEAGQLDEQSQNEWASVLQRRINAQDVARRYDYRNISPKVTDQLLGVYNNWQATGVAKFVETTSV